MVKRILGWLAGFLIFGILFLVFSIDLIRGNVDPAIAQTEISSGQRTYNLYCIGCHGDGGEGNGEAAEFLNPKPRNFVNEDYKFFHFGEAGPFPSDQSLALTIRNGLPGSAMPAFPLLSDQEVTDVQTYIKSLRAGGWETTAAEPAKAVAIDGETGEELFTNAGCIACHQLDALGSIGGIGPDLSQIGSRLDVNEIITSIAEPNVVIAELCPAGPCPENVMPDNFDDRLTVDQIEILADLLFEQK